MSLDRDETKLGHVRGRQASKERKGGCQEANASGKEGREADEKDGGKPWVTCTFNFGIFCRFSSPSFSSWPVYRNDIPVA